MVRVVPSGGCESACCARDVAAATSANAASATAPTAAPVNVFLVLPLRALFILTLLIYVGSAATVLKHVRAKRKSFREMGASVLQRLLRRSGTLQRRCVRRAGLRGVGDRRWWRVG